MARQKTGRDPFEVRLSEDEEKELADQLSREIEDAITARGTIVGDDGDIDKWHQTYEGGDGRLTRDTPWPGAANLTSYIGTEKVDALRARIMQTVFVDPIWIVEGWGDSAPRAAFVERFHQWKAEEERLQGFLGKVIHNSLIEGTGVLEVSEKSEWRRIRANMEATLELDPMTGGPAIDMDGMPVFKKDQQGQLVEADDPTVPRALTTIERYVRSRRGPQYRVLSLKDFFILPGHAADKTEVWGYAKRFWRRVGQLKSAEAQGFYRNTDKLGEDSERDPSTADTRAGQAVAQQLGDRVEKELWEVPFLLDHDKDGIEEWYRATVSRNKRVILRVQRDDLAPNSFLLFTPFPRPGSMYGYSFIGVKLGTIIDEHTAQRNAIADRSSLVNSAPLLRVVGALWDPYEQPFGPRAVLDVRDKNEISALQIPDVPGSLVDQMSTTLAAAERLSGLNDATLGVNPKASRTLGEFTNVLQQSFIRIDEIIRNLQETVEDLWNVRHEIWRRTLREQGPIHMPDSIVAAVDAKFRVPENMLTAALLDGAFRGKPHGSVETADLNRQRQDFIGFLQALAQLVQAVPGLQMIFSQPPAAQSILKQAMRVFQWQDRAGLTGVPDELQATGMTGMAQQMGMPMPGGAGAPGMPGMPPGMPTGAPGMSPGMSNAGMGPGAGMGAPGGQALPALLSQLLGRGQHGG